MKKPKNSTNIIITCLALVLLAASLAGLTLQNAPLAGSEVICFNAPEGDRLIGTYTAGNLPYGVMLLEGFGNDQITMQPIAVEFAELGLHVFTFDFSGHGRSSGASSFDNSATDHLALQSLSAKEAFKTLSGLSDDHIIVIGHSLGARVALQAATMDAHPPAGLILLGTQVNLNSNIQSELFTGIQDTQLDWIQGLSAQNPATNIYMISGTWDDTLPPPAALDLLQKLSQPNAQAGQPYGNKTQNTFREHVLLPTLLHNYEVFSSSAMTQAKSFTSQVFELKNTVSLQANTASLRPWLWLGALIGLFGSLLSGNAWVYQTRKPSAGPCAHIKIVRLRRFLLSKILLWFAALPLAAILSALFFLVPLRLPLFNMIYIGLIGGYGLLMLILYCTKRCPGTVGKLSLHKNGHKTNHNNGKIKGGIWLALLVWLVVLFSAVLFTHSGWFYIIAPNERLIWLALFTPITALGFWVGTKENTMLTTYQVETGKQVRLARIALTMIGLLPFFIYTIFMGILGSTSGTIGGLRSLLILVLVLLSGSLINRLSGKAWLSALLQAILLYALVLPQGVLFAF